MKKLNLNKPGIYLVIPNGKKLKPLDLDKRRINIVAKVNNLNIKFGKSERPLINRYKDYKKIFGEDVNFNPILIIEDIFNLKRFENYISIQFNNYKISNPNSNRKLEWMSNISFNHAKSIILKSYKEFSKRV
tara:strand:- start:32 stop:427 length:396 start_codon:yes stop_codon:yes gene_type:complete